MIERNQENHAVIVPAYREASHIGEVVRGIREHGFTAVVVDDGSPDSTASVADAAGATVLRHACNMGKGAALGTGFRYAAEQGWEFAITMDGDGQHDPADLSRFVDAYRRERWPAVIGNRMGNPTGMPWLRRATNRFMSWLLSREMGQFVPDTQSGYRLYAREVFGLVDGNVAGFAAESDVLLRIAERGYRIGSVPIRVIYRDEKSKIRPFRDTLRFIAMLTQYRKHRRQAKRAIR